LGTTAESKGDPVEEKTGAKLETRPSRVAALAKGNAKATFHGLNLRKIEVGYGRSQIRCKKKNNWEVGTKRIPTVRKGGQSRQHDCTIVNKNPYVAKEITR